LPNLIPPSQAGQSGHFPGFSGFPGVSGKISENSGPDLIAVKKFVIFQVRLFTPPLVDILILSPPSSAVRRPSSSTPATPRVRSSAPALLPSYPHGVTEPPSPLSRVTAIPQQTTLASPSRPRSRLPLVPPLSPLLFPAPGVPLSPACPCFIFRGWKA
jgi:hypothetical protein